jgi:hypothetical protein
MHIDFYTNMLRKRDRFNKQTDFFLAEKFRAKTKASSQLEDPLWQLSYDLFKIFRDESRATKGYSLFEKSRKTENLPGKCVQKIRTKCL